MFGLGRKNKGFDMLLIMPKDSSKQGKMFCQIIFPAAASVDFIQLMTKLQKSKLNDQEYLGDYGGFDILTHIEGAEKIHILDNVHPEAEPIALEDIANQIVNRFNSIMSHEEPTSEDEDLQDDDRQEELVYFIGEFTMMKDGSF